MLTVEAMIAHLLSHASVADWSVFEDAKVGMALLALCRSVD